MTDTRDLRLALVLSVLLVFVALPFGSVTPGWRLVPSVIVPILFVAALWRRTEPLDGRVPATLVAAVAGVGFLQTIQLPSSLLQWLSPRVHSTLPEQPHPLSVAPSVTWTTSIWWLIVAATLAVAAAAGRSRGGRRVLASALVVSGMFQAIYGGQRFLGDSGRVWGVDVPTQGRRLSGTFVNPDHLAFHLVLVVPFAFALLWWVLEWRGLRDRPENRLLAAFGATFVLASLLIALALSGSRGGLVAMAVAVCCQGFLLSRATGRRVWGLSGAVVLLGGLGLLTWLSLDEQGLQRLLETSRVDLVENHRLVVYEATVDLWRHAPLFGIGLGAFREALALVRPPELDREWWHAHSDVLELLASTGVVGGLLVGALVGLTVVRLRRVLQFPRRSEDVAMATALLGCLVGAGAHSAVDFSLTIPANALALSALAGLAWSLPRVSGDQNASGPRASAAQSDLEEARGPRDIDRERELGTSSGDVEDAE